MNNPTRAPGPGKDRLLACVTAPQETTMIISHPVLPAAPARTTVYAPNPRLAKDLLRRPDAPRHALGRRPGPVRLGPATVPAPRRSASGPAVHAPAAHLRPG